MNLHLKLFLQSVFGRISGNYGHDAILREYTDYPRFLPLNAQIQHGWYGTEIPDFKKMREIPFMLVWSRRIADLWKKNSKKPVFVMGSPFVLYREMHGIKQKDDAAGTVVFPNHSTPGSTVIFDVQAYCDELKKLPGKMQPVTVCLHFRDMDRYGPFFRKNRFPVVTAGDSRQGGDEFVRRYYEILSSHKYSCSNSVGSSTFYSVEMGIPFFIYGPPPEILDNSDHSVKEINGYCKEVKEVYEKFLSIHDKPTAEQKALVLSEIGFGDRVSARFLKSYFLKCFFLYEIPHYSFRFALAVITTIEKMKIKVRGLKAVSSVQH